MTIMNTALFDLDGTLADTEILKAEALSAAITKLGGSAPPEIYKNVMGKSWEVVTNHFFDHANIKATTEDLNPIFKEHYSTLIEEKLEDTRNAKSIIQHFRKKDFKIGLVSSASPWMVEKVLKKLNADAEHTIAFEDSESGFQAAAAAKIKVIGIKHSFNANHDFKLCGRIIESFKDYLK